MRNWKATLPMSLAAAAAAALLPAGCAAPKAQLTLKTGAVAYPAVAADKVSVFEGTPDSGSYIELGEAVMTDELTCSVGDTYGEERALQIMEELRKTHSQHSAYTDVAMLEIVAEEGGIARQDVCPLTPRFANKEDKVKFIQMALTGLNVGKLKEVAGLGGANAVMKVKHEAWTMKSKPTSLGEDTGKAPSIKVGVKSMAAAIHYEPGKDAATVEGGAPIEESKIAVAAKEKEEPAAAAAAEGKAEPKEAKGEKKDKKADAKPEKKAEGKGETKEKEPAKTAEVKAVPAPPVEGTKGKSKEPEKTGAAAAKTEKAPVEKAEKKEEPPASSAPDVEAKQKEIQELEKKLAEKKKAATAEINEDQKKIAAMKEELVQQKVLAAKMKAEEEKKKKEEEAKAKAEAKKKADEEKLKKEEEAKAKAEAKKKKAEAKPEEKKEAEKEPETAVEESEDPVETAKAKIKEFKSEIFACFHKSDVEGSVKVTYLFKPDGKIDALGFEPDMPEAVLTCITGIFKTIPFPSSPKYYKAIFKYNLKAD